MLSAVEGPLGQDRLFAHLPPTDAVRRRYGEQLPLYPHDGLVPLVVPGVGIVVAEGREVDAGPHPYKVVFLRALELQHAKVRLVPVDAVVALRIGCEGGGVRTAEAHRVAPVPATVLAPVRERVQVADAAALPGPVDSNGRLARGRTVETPPRPVVPVDPEVVDE